MKRYRPGPAADDTPFFFGAYRSTLKRSPHLDAIVVPQTLSEVLHRNTLNPAREYFVRMTRRDWKRE